MSYSSPKTLMKNGDREVREIKIVSLMRKRLKTELNRYFFCGLQVNHSAFSCGKSVTMGIAGIIWELGGKGELREFICGENVHKFQFLN